MTVRELLDKLNEIIAADPTVADRIVKVEGCDCTGDADGVEVSRHDLLITR